MCRVDIYDAIKNKLHICYKFKNYRRKHQSKIECFKIIDYKEIEKDEIDNLKSLSRKTPILNGKLVMLRIKIVSAETIINHKGNEVFIWNIDFSAYNDEDLCLEDEDGYKFERIQLWSKSPLLCAKYRTTVGAHEPIRTHLFLIPNEDSKMYIGLNDRNGELSICDK